MLHYIAAHPDCTNDALIEAGFSTATAWSMTSVLGPLTAGRGKDGKTIWNLSYQGKRMIEGAK